MSDPREVELPDGRTLEIRPARLADAEQLSAMDKALAEDGRGMVLTVDQVRAVDDERVRIDLMYRKMSTGDASLIIVALIDGQMVGSAEFGQLRPKRCQHVGVLSLGVHPGCQRAGVGRALMNYVIDHARRSGTRRLELYTRADNTRARTLYESLGFAVEGVRRGFVALDDGTLIDDLTMVRWL